MDVSASAVSNWEAGRAAFPAETLIIIAKALRVSPAWLLEGREIEEPGALLDLVGLVQCDTEGWFNPNKIAIKVPLPPGVEASSRMFAVLAVGDSMEPEGIREGNVLYCDPSAPLDPGDAVFFQTKEGKVTVKKFVSMSETYYYLRGWMKKDAEGHQKIYSYELLKQFVTLVAPVIFVKRKA